MSKIVSARGAGTVSRLWPWIGGLTATSAQIVTRYTAMPARLRMEVSPTLSPWAPVAVTEPVAVDGTTGAAKFDVTGLTPGGSWYAAERQGSFLNLAQPLRFKTFPTTGDVRIWHGSCFQNSGTNQARVCEALIAELAALGIDLGDWFYFNPDTVVEAIHRGHYDTTMAKTPRRLLHEALGIASGLSDHEINNDADRTNPGTPAARAVYSQFRAHYPLLVAGCLYQRIRCSDLDIIMLDTRTCRDPKTQTDDANKTLLGAAQSAQLVSDLTSWVRPFGPIILCSDCEVGGPQVAGRDSWPGYHLGNPGGRRWLFDLIESLGLGDRVVIYSGDMHGSGTDLGDNHRYSTSGTIRVKVVAASPFDQQGVGGFATYSEGGQFLPTNYGGFAFDGQWALSDWAYSGGATGILTIRQRRCHPTTGVVSTLRTTPFTFAMN